MQQADALLVDAAAAQLQRLDGVGLADGLGQLARAALAERVVRQVDMPEPVPVVTSSDVML